MKFMRSHSCVLGSCQVCLPFSGSNSRGPTPVSSVLVWFVFWVSFMRFYCRVLGSCLLCFFGKILAVIFLFRGSCIICLPVQIHALILLYPMFLSALSDELSQEYSSRGPTPVCWVLVWFVFRVKFIRSYSSHSCVLASCLVCLMGQLHAVPLLCPGFLSGWSCGSNSCGQTLVTWVLVWFVFLGQLYAVPLLCHGFLSGLSYGSTSCGHTPVSWVLVWFVFRVNFKAHTPDIFVCFESGIQLTRSHSGVLGCCLVCLMNEIHAVPLLC